MYTHVQAVLPAFISNPSFTEEQLSPLKERVWWALACIQLTYSVYTSVACPELLKSNLCLSIQEFGVGSPAQQGLSCSPAHRGPQNHQVPICCLIYNSVLCNVARTTHLNDTCRVIFKYGTCIAFCIVEMLKFCSWRTRNPQPSSTLSWKLVSHVPSVKMLVCVCTLLAFLMNSLGS